MRKRNSIIILCVQEYCIFLLCTRKTWKLLHTRILNTLLRTRLIYILCAGKIHFCVYDTSFVYKNTLHSCVLHLCVQKHYAPVCKCYSKNRNNQIYRNTNLTIQNQNNFPHIKKKSPEATRLNICIIRRSDHMSKEVLKK